MRRGQRSPFEEVTPYRPPRTAVWWQIVTNSGWGGAALFRFSLLVGQVWWASSSVAPWMQVQPRLPSLALRSTMTLDCLRSPKTI